MRDKVQKVLVFLVFLVIWVMFSFCSGELWGRWRWYSKFVLPSVWAEMAAKRLLSICDGSGRKLLT
eukprot:4262264-Amphidinium_carterae.1